MPDQTEGQQISRAAYERLKAELDELTTTGRAQIAERLQRARELGDLSENAEYHETKDQQGLMESRIAKIESILRSSEVLETIVESDSAIPGTIVGLRSLEDDEVDTYLFAQSSEERAQGMRTVTIGSPLGQAMSGKRIGDKVSYQAPGGTFSYEVVSIDPWKG